MIIRRDQIRVFEDFMKDAFEDRMVAHMASRYPGQYTQYTRDGQGDQGARTLVRRAIEKAANLGAKREGSIQQLLEIMLETSPEFDTDPAMAWTRFILDDRTLNGGTRILLVHQKLPDFLARQRQHTEQKD